MRCVALAENVNDWMSCHDFTAPVARLRNSTRVGCSGLAALAPRAAGPAPVGVPGTCAGAAEAGVVAGAVAAGGV